MSPHLMWKPALLSADAREHQCTAEFREFLDEVEATVPGDLDVGLVINNAATHKAAVVHDGLIKRPNWRLHLTPTSASC